MSEKKELKNSLFSKENAQIGYMREGINIPEFDDLILSKKNINIFIDFYPIIDKLHSLCTDNQDDKIFIKFNSLYDYWSDFRIQKDKSKTVIQSENIIYKSYELLNSLDVELKNYLSSFKVTDEQQAEMMVKGDIIKKYLDIYIEVILYIIHTKALSEIEYFKENTSLNKHIKSFMNIIKKLYYKAIGIFIDSLGYSTPKELYDMDFYKHLLLEKKEEELNYFFKFLNIDKEEDYSVDSFKVHLFNQLEKNSESNNINTRYYIQYNNNALNEVEDIISKANIYIDTFFKIKSIFKLLEKLKELNIEYSSEICYSEELTKYLENDNVD